MLCYHNSPSPYYLKHCLEINNVYELERELWFFSSGNVLSGLKMSPVFISDLRIIEIYF